VASVDTFSALERGWNLETGSRLFAKELRQSDHRHGQASAGIFDSQSVKTTERGGCAVLMVGKKVIGGKRPLVNTLGLIVAIAKQISIRGGSS